MLLWIFLLTACGPAPAATSAPATEIVPPTRQVTPAQTSIQKDFVPQGSLILGCFSTIYQYKFGEKDGTLLIRDESGVYRVYSDVNVVGDWIYFFRTTDLKKQELPAGGGIGPNDVFRMKLSGNDFEQLTHDDYYDFSLSSSSTANKLVFASDRRSLGESSDRYNVIVWDIAKMMGRS
jgi:hypothetical protein